MRNKTIDYYNKHGLEYSSNTKSVEMTDHYSKFESMLNEGAVILDAGCGSGRDTKHFLETGFKVNAFDGSKAMSKFASEFTGIDVACASFTDYKYLENYYDGIWCCAALLHLSRKEIRKTIKSFYKALKNDGIVYLSFKYGTGELTDANGRYFSLLNEDDFVLFTDGGLSIENSYISNDNSGRDVKWMNLILRKHSAGQNGV